MKAIENEIESLVPIEIVINDISVPINCTLFRTMVDRKVINNLTDTSSQRCFICNYGPKNMNDLKNIQKFAINEDNLKYGLSALHAWNNFLKCVLNISHKLNIHQSTNRISKEKNKKFTKKKK